MDLISEIVHFGFSLPKMADALMEQERPGGHDIEKHNKDMAIDNPLMAPVEDNSIEYGSLAAGHTYQGFRAFIAELEHPDDLVTVNGKLSLEKLKERDSLYAHHANGGVPCKVSAGV